MRRSSERDRERKRENLSHLITTERKGAEILRPPSPNASNAPSINVLSEETTCYISPLLPGCFLSG
ncbi:hypothetical protein JZ751_015089 [Albula glossodonta]|uniref:Uncharacterized protein n=1 Tax=Albula glossodonta TaxID=121402 RepID=A0A8T2NPS3_9TELE|nr:hypothetical protein JZ751_015089 [Albula glossodonta]